MDSLQIQKQLMVEQLNKLEYMDKILPLHKNEVQAEKKLQVQINSLNFKRIIEGQENNKLMAEIEESKLDVQKSRHKAFQKYFTSFMTEKQQQDVNILEFNQSDFEVFQQLKERQRQLAQEDLTIARQKEKTNQIFEQNLMKKWDRVRKKLRMIGRMKRLYDEVKLYGTSCRVETSIKRHEVIQELEQMLNKQNQQISKPMPQKHKHLFLPDSIFKKYWQYVLMILLIYTAFITPIRLAFIEEFNIIWFSLELIVDILFFLDILITFNTAYFNEEGVLIVDRQQIANQYLRTWFIFDLMAIFPTDQIFENEVQKLSQYFKLTRLPRMYKLISISRMWSTVQNSQQNNDCFSAIQDLINLNSTTVRVLKFFGTVLVCVHIMGCLWYLVAKLNYFGPNTWVYELDLLNKSEYELYLTSIYWAVATICTVGFGDIHAFNDTERIVCIFWMFFGVGFYSFTVGSLSTLMGTLDTRESHLQSKITFMDEFCEETKLSLQMKHKIRKVLEYNSLINIFSSAEVDDFLSEIPTNLKYQIAQAMYAGLKNRVSFFKNKDSVFISTLIPKLQPLKINAGEFIYNKGEYPNQVYFIVNGRVNMVIGVYSITFKTYVTGSYFGEIEIFDNSARFHSARAELECELLAIEQDVFKKILQAFPEYFEEIKVISLEKLKREKDSIEKLQDLTGLSQTSEFFNKKRTQSIYKSIKQRESVHFIDNSEESEQDIKSMRSSKFGFFKKKTNHLTPEETFTTRLHTQEDNYQKNLVGLESSQQQNEQQQKIITLSIPDQVKRQSEHQIKLYGEIPNEISQFNEDLDQSQNQKNNQRIQSEEPNRPPRTKQVRYISQNLRCSPKRIENRKPSIQITSAIEITDTPLISSVRSNFVKPSIKIDEASHESEGSNKNSPKMSIFSQNALFNAQTPQNSSRRNSISQKLPKPSPFQKQQSIFKTVSNQYIEASKLKNLPRLGGFRRTYRKEREIEVLEETIENEDYTQLQQKLVELLEKIKKQKEEQKIKKQKIQFNIINPLPKKIVLQQKDSISISDLPDVEKQQLSKQDSNSSGILE
ncbi:unnamed protein product [Paramecium primaurelia]|uniref:Cyclic nucleotide-binding domain-containing protein n=1 Tax=Paramecium primaurelia TaxID=5886 RepID=A0A8S1PM32_PARPR|nr:unnamed protein product [Paramecium primaurelia]